MRSMAMEGAFEARLGVGEKSDRSTSSAEITEEIEVAGGGGGSGLDDVVLVVIDVNEKLSLIAFNWALVHVVQRGDTVRLLGVLHHIVNPMGYKSRADEKSWNGASRRVLEEQVATHVAILKSVPSIYTVVEKKGAKLDIDVRANPHPKNLVIEEAKRHGARYVVIDRHIKKDKQFYINNLTCYVTRVKTMTIIEHLRHGVPAHCGPGETDPAASPTTETETSSVPTSVENSNFEVAMQTPPLQLQQPTAVRPNTRTTSYDPSIIYDSPPRQPNGVEFYPPQLQGYSSYRSPRNGQLAVHDWLVNSVQGTDPDVRYSAPEYGLMTMGPEAAMQHQYLAPMSPFTEAALQANLYYSNNNPYNNGTQLRPPVYSTNPPENNSPYNPPLTRTRTTRTNSTQGEDASALAELMELHQLGGGENNHQGTRGGPISVHAIRADPNYPLDWVLQTQQQSPVKGGHSSMISPGTGEEDLSDQVSSVRRAVSSKKLGSGTPPLCTVCQQKSPVFGKVKRFTFAELQDATNEFSQENYLAKGGYGTVYKGRLKNGQLVAVKQHALSSSQGDEEFCAEVEVLSCAQHRNLVTLIGYCVERHMRLLVYEYVCNGSLDIHLSPKSKTDLQWHHRHKIALGAARALRYLHEECRVGCIVHRDMRPNNILLTHDFTPMVGDFGLARRQSSGDLAEETRVLGTIGYLAPEYAETGQITDKADVYAFGVVLLELLSGRKAIEHNRPRKQVSLVEWARPLLASYDKESLLDPRLKGQYNEYELQCMMHAATQCIKKDPSRRPRMNQVLRMLNPPQERDWAFVGPGRPVLQKETPDLGKISSSASSSRTSSCSQSDVSVASHSKPFD